MKRIITCSDGTWNKVGSTDGGVLVQTNVEKMYNSICSVGNHQVTKEPVQQLKAYDQGVGTGYTLKDKIIGGATGAGIDKNIKDMYTFFVLNYNVGDEIYLFGFSRGAYTARSLAGFIRTCGILKPEYVHLVEKAYDLYRDRNSYSTPDSDLMIAFRRNYAYENITRIKFIGVWDTVGSLGIPLSSFKMRNLNRYKFHDVTLSSTIDNAYHALAIDERRALFSPTLWEKSRTVKEDESHPQKMEQRWFAGCHSNIGGGYKDAALSNIALKWLIDKAELSGLCFNEPPLIKENPDYDKGIVINSYTPMYWLTRPVWRNIILDDETNQVIDETVQQRYAKDEKYRPKNLSRIWSEENLQKGDN